MKIRNKKTGEIVDLKEGMINDTYDGEKIEVRSVAKRDNEVYAYSSLAELNEEWEDYEEPKEYWYINEFGTPTKADFVGRETLYDKCRKVFGNYFPSREEAELAVRKLKAWKRLKDSGFRINNWVYALEGNRENGSLPLEIKAECKLKTPYKDLDLLFGGEE